MVALCVFGLPFAASGFSGFAAAEAFGFAIVALLAIWLTYLGFGSIALWAFRFAWVQFGALGTLMSRASPPLVITVVVYFTGELWQLPARMTRQRLWQTIGFLVVVAVVFVVTTIRDEVRALRELFALLLVLGIVAVPDDVACCGPQRKPVRSAQT